MSPDIVITARGVTKTYRLFGHSGDRIKQFLSLGVGRYHRDFTALRDVTFDIRKGETIGIIGRNGSGKSTLLQLVCGILKPTSGSISVSGSVSALLELGAGFNPEFTGRENIYFQGAVMGFAKAQMDERFDDIAAFADIGTFIDQPVRIYSNGMFLRLAFAVAVHVDSEILVVDEALAVGDAGFRSRCFRRIAELRNAGCTILFVSHAMDQIIRFCTHAMLLDEGELLLAGPPGPVVAQFQRLLSASPATRQTSKEQLRRMHAIGVEGDVGNDTNADWVDRVSGMTPSCSESSAAIALEYEPNGALIESVRIVDTTGQRANQLRTGQSYCCAYRVSFTRDASNIRYAMLIRTRDGLDLGGAMSAPSMEKGVPGALMGSASEVEFEFVCKLNPGTYLVNVAVFASDADVEYALHGIQGALTFLVVADPDSGAIGPVDFSCQPSVRVADTTVQ